LTDSTTQPSAAMTTAASKACQNVNGANPGTMNPTNISTSADTTKRTTVPMKFTRVTSFAGAFPALYYVCRGGASIGVAQNLPEDAQEIVASDAPHVVVAVTPGQQRVYHRPHSRDVFDARGRRGNAVEVGPKADVRRTHQGDDVVNVAHDVV